MSAIWTKYSITFIMEAQNLALIDQDVLEEEIFENNVFIHVHGPRTGTGNVLGSKYVI